MTALCTSSFREDDPAGLARSLRVMAASIPENGTVTVTLTPAAARIAAHAIDAGLSLQETLWREREEAWAALTVQRLFGRICGAVLAVALIAACAALTVLP